MHARPAILIVDDDASVSHALRRALRRTHDIDLAGDGDEALAVILGGKRYAVILSDIAMPRMSGLDLFESLASAVPQQAQQLVFLTGGVAEPVARRIRQTGVPQLEKPVDLTVLRDTIDRLVASAPG